MSLILSKSPAGTDEMVAQAVRRAHTSKFSRRSDMGGGIAAVMTPVSPLPVYLLDLKQINHVGLDTARPVGWQSLILQGKNPVAAVDFNSDENGKASVLKSYNQGVHVQSVASAISVAESLAEVAAANYEPRLLQLPAINLIALWLHGPKDILIPLDPAPGAFKPNVAYEPKSFLNLTVKLALHRHTFDDRPQPPTPTAAKPDLVPEAEAKMAEAELAQDYLLAEDDKDQEPPLSAAG